MIQTLSAQTLSKLALQGASELLARYQQGDRSFPRSCLQYAFLRGADLRRANLQGSDLHGANLRYANLRGSNLADADLRCADLRYADLEGACLEGANLSGSHYDHNTCFSLGFDPVAAGMQLFE
ncbi:pentapeptide repeat-containing protein [Synechococcus sp. Nb3U1]|uniref:pentapeptide repeat-containing protein n=1 Tax=Synechococcus sp. Nb3U1 TaxID=1914529 RepID=UPI001F2C1ED9|nr:pentapeptide repeat-containing protein [Synechococcus sp. Nb3U1]MCF2970175.1 pentapeptide repeat-containing protein [Synechococcus sp. Nb3U1]